MLLQVCSSQIDQYSFTVTNTVSDQTYSDAGVDMSTVNTATLFFKKVNDIEANEISVDISDTFQYLFETGGMTVNFSDFGLDTIYDQTFFPDWLWEIRIEYVYDGETYTASTTVGFLKIIKNIVYQQMMKSNWKKELACTCNCEPYNTTLRKWDYFKTLEIASELCLINEYLTTLQALYNLTGTTHEFE